MKLDVLLIDPQVDFCNETYFDLQGNKTKAALYVKGAEEHMAKAGAMIQRLAKKIDDIHVTLDSHHFIDIAHPMWFRDTNGNHPGPYSIITSADVEGGKWIPLFYRRTLDYLRELDARKRYPHMIWPEHCLIGSVGTAITPDIWNALTHWIKERNATVDFVSKGSNIYTEHFSGVMAEVPDPEDPSTRVNPKFVKMGEESDIILVMGEASSHCLANTVRDMVANFSDKKAVEKIHFVKGCSGPVPNCEKMEEDFLRDMIALGMKVVEPETFLS